MILKILHFHYTYILVLFFSIGGMWFLDKKYQLVFYHNKRGALLSISTVMGLLLLFDILGVIKGIFATNQQFVTGLYIVSPNIPIEELCFLFLLCYVTLSLYGLIIRWQRSHA